MIVFTLVAAALSIAVTAALVRSLSAPRRRAAARAAYALAAYRQQLAEVDRDLERGLLVPSEADALRTEIKRRILAVSDENDALDDEAVTLPRRWPAVALAIGVPAAALSLYALLGQPAVPDQPFAERPAPAVAVAAPAGNAPAEFANALAALEKHLQEQPEDARGWLLLGRAYRAEERYADAARAFGEVYRRAGQPAEIAADYGEARIAAGDGRVDDEALRLMHQALAADARDARARFYLALAKAQAGDIAGALQGWVDLAALSAPDAPFLPIVRDHIERAAAALGIDPAGLSASAEAKALAADATTGPSAAEVEAAEGMSAEERAAMVRAMVDRLAARLQAQPDDRQGWLRLAKAYDVLGEAEKAQQARARADALAR